MLESGGPEEEVTILNDLSDTLQHQRSEGLSHQLALYVNGINYPAEETEGMGGDFVPDEKEGREGGAGADQA